MSIPKIIHYCWFGRNPKTELIKKCIESWKKYLPEYKIIEWNEDNYDIYKNQYIKDAYSCKKWAFVSDYVRFDVLNQYGGVYFDTDVELLKPIPEEYLQHNAFTGFESSGLISPGLIMASECRSELLKELLGMYNSFEFLKNDKPDLKTVNEFISELMLEKGFTLNDKYQCINNIAIYPSEYFCGFDLDVREPNITSRTISIHHYAGTWIKISLKRRIQNLIKKIIGVSNYKKIILAKRKIIGVNK
ncbi:glycosyltransferase family 32 protein [Clostridium perfringens]